MSGDARFELRQRFTCGVTYDIVLGGDVIGVVYEHPEERGFVGEGHAIEQLFQCLGCWACARLVVQAVAMAKAEQRAEADLFSRNVIRCQTQDVCVAA